MKQRINLLFISLILLSNHFTITSAWGTLGHEIVGNLAWYHLSPQAKLWVNETLKLTTTSISHNDVDPTMTPLGKVADWADQVRHYLGWSSPLHFIDVRDDLIDGGCVTTETTQECSFHYERDCENDVCAAGAILNYTKQLMGSTSPSNKRRHQLRGERPLEMQDKTYNLTQSLMFLTHFVGDIHQPLHASRKSDKGGNDYHVHFTLPTEDTDMPASNSHHHSWNLHSVWDTAMIEVVLGRNYNHSRHTMEQDLYHSELYKEVLQHSSDSCNLGTDATCVTSWGQDSFALALKYAYVESDNTTQVSNGSTLDELYYESRIPIIKQQLILGGIRLAKTIEAIVASLQPNYEEQSPLAAPSKLLRVWKTMEITAAAFR